jgi:hypothetical protein
MAAGTHRCSVEGCPNLAAYEVMLYDFDLAEGAVGFVEDDACPFICVEHAIENERRSKGARDLRSVVHYPYTNRGGALGLTLYLQLHPALMA